jgi:hypothetical protein
MRSPPKKTTRRGKSSKPRRSAAARAIAYEQPTVEERKAVAAGRRAYGRGEFVDVETYFAERARRASVPKALRILKGAGVGKPPTKGDELVRRRKRRSAPHP